ncbi:hypothetical protein B0I72DRAFT_140328 [Yarrowia lipolytica]|uniref:YALI0A10681p n=2 Tax=Yarrowia lipolytica TaxID=4952 RepID=Q6CHA8_YARLI|nr:YALI0A10681p [Yarrowia lipolytica CLIB122]AOW00497.1 hypothetical protein YALI1_A10784g [Yarrowia lipolytica]KAB8282965.1 hypothetical protein BKA91DRAFT_137651 [Yarrowia lipolytica]KAE8168797.1 hypothetical protein BKA90DRAFT_143659 [Yarrowia lipolytica]KAJ8051560.1 hypothetical protein LXG23DRAFT_51128 [Yarrowia lipolytica]RDW24266.1 hypothetical protein B0I71DRAFT_134554 [Yarrowia lipolytica]|eukprot:XP_499954.1 YALI0A10681p [Yarrowia lipolytica CLIB122]
MDFSLRSPMKHGTAFGVASPSMSPSVSEAIMKEMNDRAKQIVEQGDTGSPTKRNAGPSNSAAAVAASYTPSRRSARATSRFGRAHQRSFKNMDSISNHYAAQRDRAAAAGSGGEPERMEIYNDAKTPEKITDGARQRDVVSSAAKRRKINIFGRKLELAHTAQQLGSPTKENMAPVSPAKDLAALRSPEKMNQENLNLSPVKLNTLETSSPIKKSPSKVVDLHLSKEEKEPSSANTNTNTSTTAKTIPPSHSLRHMKSKTNMSRPPTKPVGFSLSTDRRAERTIPSSASTRSVSEGSRLPMSHSQSTRSLRGHATSGGASSTVSAPTLSPSKSTPSLSAAAGNSRLRTPSVRMPPLGTARKTSASEPSTGARMAPRMTKSSTMSNLRRPGI